MGEAVGEQRPARHLGQQVGDADARQHRVEAGGERLGLRRRRFFDRRDLQHPLLERDIGQQAALRLGIDRRQTRIEKGAAAGDETLEIGIDRDRQGAALQQLLQNLAGDQVLFEGAIAAAADDPDVARAQPAAQLRQHAELVIAPVDLTAGHHISGPSLADEAGRGGFRQLERRGLVHVAQHVDGAQQRGGGRPALKGEGGEKRRRPAAHRSVVLAQPLVGIEVLRARQRFRFGDAGAKALPRDDRGDRLERVLPALARRNQGGADARIETDLLVDGASVGLKGAGMPRLGLGEHGPDEPLEQIHRLIGQSGAQLDGPLAAGAPPV